MTNEAYEKRKDKIQFAKEKAVDTTWSVEQKKKIEDVDPEEKVEILSNIDKNIVSHGIRIPARMLFCSTRK